MDLVYAKQEEINLKGNGGKVYVFFSQSLTKVIKLGNQSLYVCSWSLFGISNSFSRFCIAKLIFYDSCKWIRQYNITSFSLLREREKEKKKQHQK